MGQAKKPDDWILLGTLAHGVQKAMSKIKDAADMDAAGETADATAEFAASMVTLSGIEITDTDGAVRVTRGERAAVVGQVTGPGDLGGDEETQVTAFGGSLADPMGLGRQLGAFLCKMMNLSGDTQSLGDRVAWLHSLMLGMASTLRTEIPIPIIAAIYARTAGQSLATHIIASQISERFDFGMPKLTLAEFDSGMKLMDFATDKTPPELLPVLEWIDKSGEVEKLMAALTSLQDIESLGYGSGDDDSGNGETRH